MKKLLICFLAAAVLAGCFKDVSYKTHYIINPLRQVESGDPAVQFTDFKAYAFSADTAKWTVASYEDAVAGILTSKEVPGQKLSESIAVAEPYESGDQKGRFAMSISKESQMVLAVDMQDKLYAYTQQQLGINLPELYVTLVFSKWRTGFSYKADKWSFYNQFYVPPVYVNFFVDPKMQSTENGEQTAIASAKAYAFAADTTAWYIASYNDAVTGTITSKTDPKTTRSNNISATEEEGLYRMRVSDPTLMVVVVDKTNKLYAYRHQTVDLNAEPVTVPIVFREWKKQYLYVEEGWRVVDDSLKVVPKPAKRIR